MTTAQNERTFLVGKLPVTLRTSPRRTKDLSITADGRVLVRAPHGTSNTEAAALVRRRREWIYRQLHRRQGRRLDRPAKQFDDGEEFQVHGVPHRLRLTDVHAQDDLVEQYRSSETEAWLHLRSDAAAHPNRARNALIHWYARRTQSWLDLHRAEFARNRHHLALGLRVTAKLSSSLVAYRPRHELVLSWSCAQLPDRDLRTLVADALGLADAGDLPRLRKAYRSLWLGDIRHPQSLVTADWCAASDRGHRSVILPSGSAKLPRTDS
ncbi:DUF45 domain-containing protein [Streptomyces sp. TRM66268-LWL]|uniref:DUF45 domain-containing protein n=1 Tax=Streptomyces polyasparticus TaxID=2767826 RepID=A0ABR7SS51_9ACTN|nr:YgjP-like metallopeptidase domain-containing protein [Streptomyces polyasparticus]MBC9717782.1 DUF45 domain-containing protein [Streptomyces polyasparticus]